MLAREFQAGIEFLKGEEDRLVAVQKIFGFQLSDQGRLMTALTPYSTGQGKSRGHGLQRGHEEERLKFQYLALIGDKIIALVVSEGLDNCGSELWARKFSAVSNRNLARSLDAARITPWLRLHRRNHWFKPELLKPRTRGSAYEAIVGAVYLDQGLERAREFLFNTLKTKAS